MQNCLKKGFSVLAFAGTAILSSSIPAAAQTTTKPNVYVQHNLVSDIAGMADVTDPNLVDPWGLSFSATSPFWVSNAGKSNSTLYNGAGTITPVVVAIPAGSKGPAKSSPSGQVNNNTTAFILANGTKASFIFATEDGTISAWNGGTVSTVMVDNSPAGAVYEGLAIGTSANGATLYAPNFKTNAIDVFDGKFAPATLAGNFTDPTLPAGFAPFNIWNLGGKLYVMYAKQNAAKVRDTAGAGNGYVSTFDLNGNFLKRVVSNGPLNSPWGVAIAPANWAAFGGALLVGNFGDGTINAFDATSGASLGTLQDKTGAPIVNHGLWAIAFGNGGSGGDPNTLYFTAGIQGETHGLLGAIAPPSAILSVVNGASGAAGPVAPGEIVLVEGFTIGPSPRAAATVPATGTLGTTVGATTVSFDGRPAPILYASASTVAVIVPYEVSGGTTSNVTLSFVNTFNNQTPVAFPVQLGASAPGLFTADTSGSGNAAAINQDGTANSATNAAARGSVVLLFATGEGVTAPPVTDGAITVGRIVPGPLLSVSLTIGGSPARVISAESAPGTVAGVMQIEAIVPSGISVGPAAVQLTVGTTNSQAGVTLNVK
jgi:uncharacterized protein (TIGR03118 family)